MPKPLQTRPQTGVGGTVDAFNFIRRIAFPTTPQVVSIYAIVALTSAMLSLTSLGENPLSAAEFALAVLIAPPILGALVASALLANHENVLDFRRLMGLEFVALLPLATILPICSIIGVLAGAKQLWEDGLLLGLSASLPIRFLTPLAMSSLRTWRKIGAALITPLVTTLAFLILTPTIISDSNLPTIAFRVYALVISGFIVSAGGTGLIVRRVEQEGSAEIGYSPMQLFRAFLGHWLRKMPTALEDRLLTLSTEEDIETRILSFSGSNRKPKAAIIVSNFHPGPYRDLGSGGLPSEMKRAAENSQQIVAQVPHGISNHKLNIVSHRDISKLLEAVKSNYPSQHVASTATKMIREQVGEAIVSGQAFGRTALLTITLAPDEMEDLPTEVALEIDKQSSILGFKALTVDAHNSIESQTSITTAQAKRIIEAARKVLSKLDSLPQATFRVGTAENSLAPFTLKDGIGPGGLSIMTITTQNQTIAYITIDGNNMQRGLRDKILHSLNTTGVDDAEIMTTDTHLVTGLVRSPLGYHPVGDGIPTNHFIQTISETVRKATTSSENSSTGISTFSMRLPVLGSEAFNSISTFIAKIARQVGRGFYRLEALAFILAVIILIL